MRENMNLNGESNFGCTCLFSHSFSRHFIFREPTSHHFIKIPSMAWRQTLGRIPEATPPPWSRPQSRWGSQIEFQVAASENERILASLKPLQASCCSSGAVRVSSLGPSGAGTPIELSSGSMINYLGFN